MIPLCLSKPQEGSYSRHRQSIFFEPTPDSGLSKDRVVLFDRSNRDNCHENESGIPQFDGKRFDYGLKFRDWKAL